jgi:histidinol-phosphate/aromatic aminotransferase/cobyric acid decarboxylase-like protein
MGSGQGRPGLNMREMMPGPTEIVELRTGEPYARLIEGHKAFAESVAAYLGVPSEAVIPAFGATGAIESVRNYVFRSAPSPSPLMLTVSPGYWRARETFEGFGFRVAAMQTEPLGFGFDQEKFVSLAMAEAPEIIYLSMPNNPTGGILDPYALIEALPKSCNLMLDLTLPSPDFDTRSMTEALFHRFKDRPGLFLVGSTSKSHGTAQYRTGWTVCTNSQESNVMRFQNRNVLCSVSVEESIQRMGSQSQVLDRIRKCFELLDEFQEVCGLTLIRPLRSVRTGYALLRSENDVIELRRMLDRSRIRVMWGHEFGLTDQYLRIETTEPGNIQACIEALKGNQYKLVEK